MGKAPAYHRSRSLPFPFPFPLLLLLLPLLAPTIHAQTQQLRHIELDLGPDGLVTPLENNDKQQPAAAWEVPSKRLAPPSTASEALQAFISSPPAPFTQKHLTHEEWRVAIDVGNAKRAKEAPGLWAMMGLDVKAVTLGGVPVYRITPPNAKPGRVLLHLHGGAYVFGAGAGAGVEGAFVANATQTEVVSVDYRMPPEHPFPAAVEDSVAVWQALVQEQGKKKAKKAYTQLGMCGTSAGGGLAMATILKLQQSVGSGAVPLPAALSISTPWSDLTKTGDSYVVNDMVDSCLASYDGVLGDAVALYAGSVDLKDPLLSPIYGDLSGFPPTLLFSGTRDLFLSNTVRAHRKLRQAGVEAELHVFEGLSHAQWTPMMDPVKLWQYPPPETLETYKEVDLFFDRVFAR